ncbi:hypothetical protein Sste5346_009358 [Sporothrix stenoceras]|uniref:WSC domain-containing protein n=1 Tax=Sporothrix stenoceras TaxID=5173 RepID=A0ABR3YLL7_9PEZI
MPLPAPTITTTEQPAATGSCFGDTHLDYCGVEGGSLCICDSVIQEPTSYIAQAGQCSQGCVGNSNVQCGGDTYANAYAAVNIAENGTQPAAYTPASLDRYSYLGCVSDSTKRLLTRRPSSASPSWTCRTAVPCTGNRAQACCGYYRLGLCKATGPNTASATQSLVSSANTANTVPPTKSALNTPSSTASTPPALHSG